MSKFDIEKYQLSDPDIEEISAAPGILMLKTPSKPPYLGLNKRDAIAIARHFKLKESDLA